MAYQFKLMLRGLQNMPAGHLAKVSAAYVAAVNVGAFGLFFYDKNQAVNHGWRVPEKTLQLSALAGGWIGGMAAMETFRHKTKKDAFRIPYFACVAGNVALTAGALFVWRRRPKFSYSPYRKPIKPMATLRKLFSSAQSTKLPKPTPQPQQQAIARKLANAPHPASKKKQFKK